MSFIPIFLHLNIDLGLGVPAYADYMLLSPMKTNTKWLNLCVCVCVCEREGEQEQESPDGCAGEGYYSGVSFGY